MNNIFELHDIETDITVNSNIKNLFFNQLKNKDFKCDFLDNDIIVNVNLFLSNNSEYPFAFRIDTQKKIIIPQYTKTHRVYIPNKEETHIVESTISYISEKLAHPRKQIFRKNVESKNKFIGKFSGIKSRLNNNNLMSYELPKSFNDLDSSIFLDNSNDSSIKNIYIYNTIKNRENIAFIKLFNPNQYRILINPEYEDLIDVSIKFTENTINLCLSLSDSIDTEYISLICKG